MVFKSARQRKFVMARLNIIQRFRLQKLIQQDIKISKEFINKDPEITKKEIKQFKSEINQDNRILKRLGDRKPLSNSEVINLRNKATEVENKILSLVTTKGPFRIIATLPIVAIKTIRSRKSTSDLNKLIIARRKKFNGGK